MIKLICNKTLTTSLKFGYRLIHNNQVMIEEIKQWIEVKYFNDITENRDIKLNELL